MNEHFPSSSIKAKPTLRLKHKMRLPSHIELPLDYMGQAFH
jgi:hypothetical protein